MIILRLNGGLGNQMFQYAFCKNLAEKYNQQIWVDYSQFKGSNREYCLDIFKLDKALLQDTVNFEGLSIAHLQEKSFRFCESALSSFDGYDLKTKIFLISGYWQSPKYFERISSIIKDDFKSNYLIDQQYICLQERILMSESVMVHIRRGDYLHHGNLAKHGIIDITYIDNGMKYFGAKIPNALFFVFSDDVAWCKENIIYNGKIIFIKKDLDQGRSSFLLMRQCKHFLISNSTFSWWAAWLAENPGKQIICPKDWFRKNNDDSADLVPVSWIRM